MRYVLAIIVALSFIFSAQASTKLSGASINKKPGVTVQKKTKKHRKHRKYVAPPKEDIHVESFPMVLPIPVEVTDALAKSDIDEAIREIRTAQPSTKSLHLLSEMQRIQSFEKDKKVPKLERHQFYQNLGISYHNLFLFLKRSGVSNNEFYKKGLKYYKKAEGSLSVYDKSEAKLLEATLKAAVGKTGEAKNIFTKIDVDTVKDDYRALEYIAAYFAALGEVEPAVDNLKKAYELNPESVSVWIVVGDDFATVEESKEFKDLVAEIGRR